MKRALLVTSILAVSMHAPVRAMPQAGPPPAAQDSMRMGRGMRRMGPGMMGRMGPRQGMGPGGMQGDTARQRMLREQVEQRFGQMVQQELALTDPQMQQLKTVMESHQARRREIAQREMAYQRAIRGQLQPGVAANADSLNRLEAGVSHGRTEMAQLDEQYVRDLNFLTPVQRARFLMMMRNFDDRVQDLRRHRAMGMGMRGAGGPGGPGGPGGQMPRRTMLRDSLQRRPQ